MIPSRFVALESFGIQLVAVFLVLVRGVATKHDTLGREGLKYTKRNKVRCALANYFPVCGYRVLATFGFVGFGPKGSKKCYLLLVWLVLSGGLGMLVPCGCWS